MLLHVYISLIRVFSVLVISALSPRFEFDLSLDEGKHRTLSVAVKNSAASFMSRDKDVVGQVGPVCVCVCVVVLTLWAFKYSCASVLLRHAGYNLLSDSFCMQRACVFVRVARESDVTVPSYVIVFQLLTFRCRLNYSRSTYFQA